MALTVNGQETTSFAAGSNLSMLCSAESNPAAQLQWAFKGELVNSTGTWLKLINVSENQTGSYSCLAFNNNTSKYNNITRYITISSMFDISDIEKTVTICPFVHSFTFMFCLRAESTAEQQAVNVVLIPLMLLLSTKLWNNFFLFSTNTWNSRNERGIFCLFVNILLFKGKHLNNHICNLKSNNLWFMHDFSIELYKRLKNSLFSHLQKVYFIFSHKSLYVQL